MRSQFSGVDLHHLHRLGDAGIVEQDVDPAEARRSIRSAALWQDCLSVTSQPKPRCRLPRSAAAASAWPRRGRGWRRVRRAGRKDGRSRGRFRAGEAAPVMTQTF